MDESQIVDVWTLFKEYLDKKSIEMAAERYIDLCADYGVSDEVFVSSLGHCSVLDHAINYYLDLDSEDAIDEEVDWD